MWGMSEGREGFGTVLLGAVGLWAVTPNAICLYDCYTGRQCTDAPVRSRLKLRDAVNDRLRRACGDGERYRRRVVVHEARLRVDAVPRAVDALPLTG